MTDFMPLDIAVLTISDSRDLDSDKSGAYLSESVTATGHRLADRAICKDDADLIRRHLSRWISDADIQVIITTGGTGITLRDTTPEVAQGLFTKPIEGFGELFRMLSYEDIGPATMQSRAVGGLADKTLLFCLPGSSGACRLGWERILEPQLDIHTKPCNFAQLLDRL